MRRRAVPPPPEPVIFVRSGSTVIGPGAPILIPPDVGHVGYEAELAVVIGRRALRVSRAQAMRCVAGYTMHNDVSASDLIRSDAGNFVRGKNLPSSAPLGPWLATPDEVPDPYALRIRLSIDGRKLQDGSTATMLFRIDELISYISHRMPLDPGDVIATGTPAGLAPHAASLADAGRNGDDHAGWVGHPGQPRTRRRAVSRLIPICSVRGASRPTRSRRWRCQAAGCEPRRSARKKTQKPDSGAAPVMALRAPDQA